jgi:hypothetical protein
MDRAANLLDVVETGGAYLKMLLEARKIVRREGTFQIVSNNLNQLLAGQVVY